MSERIRVTKLQRLQPIPGTVQTGWHYYTPDGHRIGPFDSAEEREADLTTPLRRGRLRRRAVERRVGAHRL